tara:strand:- start:1441 stop:2391 length:951 start_codon:yes stop_codon:yes gene_type:complete
MNILISGGAGFLGSHLCDYLINQGHKLICLDNFNTGNKNNIKHLLESSSFKLINHNVCDAITFNNYEIDQIYNLASPASPPNYQIDPIYTLKTNILGSLNLLGLAKKNNARIFQASTSEVYGDPSVHPQNEEYWGNVNPIGIRSCYDESKRCAETLFFDYHRQHNISIKVTRIFNTYGPRMDKDDGRVVSNFIVQALNNDPITIYGTGKQTRSFCYVDDLINGFVKLMNSDINITGPINLGNPKEFTMIELANKIVELTNSKSKLTFKKLPQDDPQKRKPNIQAAKDNLNWEPKVSLDVGLIKTIEYFDTLLKKEV